MLVLRISRRSLSLARRNAIMVRCCIWVAELGGRSSGDGERGKGEPDGGGGGDRGRGERCWRLWWDSRARTEVRPALGVAPKSGYVAPMAGCTLDTFATAEYVVQLQARTGS